MCLEYRFYKRRFRKGSIMTSEKAYKSAVGYVETYKKIMNVAKMYNAPKVNIYYNYAQFILKRIIELYCNSFSKEEKRKFKKIRVFRHKIRI